ncbi:hypothetical protein JW805_20585 [Roseomonas aeriglobus]|nr:hypothetical protein [Roseomonas aeriglobus]MBN2973926.1 hypothetical protein [Roseomonas aeriglobus]MBN2974394.1 hypothetical protein [Roseomonas aeriglobus]
MYEGKIVAEAAVAMPRDVRRTLGRPDRDQGSAALGLAVLVIGLPLLAVRMFVWAVITDLRKLGRLAGVIGAAVRDARR